MALAQRWRDARTVALVATFAILAHTRVAGQVLGPLTEEERQVIDSWLFCTECIEHQLDSVIALGVRRPATVDTLARDLLAGLTGVRQSNLATQFRSYHTALRNEANRRGATPRLPESTYVARALERANTGSRRRAAIALARIGGLPAKSALDLAADSVANGSPRFRAPVGPTVLFVRDSVWHPVLGGP